MNNTLKMVFVGVGSFAAGATLTYFVTKKAFATIAQEEIDSVHAMYAATRKTETPEEAAQRLLTQEKLQELRERISGGSWEPAELSPANVTLNGEPVDPDVEQEPVSIFDTAENAQVATETAILNKLLEERREGVPYVITISDYHSDDFDHYDKEVLTYYEDPKGDHTLLDETESFVPDIEAVIGEAYNYFGVGSSDKDIVYVRRDDHSTDYEVHRVAMSYVEAVHRADFDSETPRRLPRMRKED